VDAHLPMSAYLSPDWLNMIVIMLENVLARLSRLVNAKRELRAGEWLLHRGDEVRSMFLVSSGMIELVRHSYEGKTAILQRAAAGSPLAEASAFSARYHCDAIATDVSAVMEIPRNDFLALLENDRDFAKSWMAYLTNQVQAARLRSEILTLKTVRQRLFAWLTFNDDKLPDKGNWRSLAFEIGVTPEALYREIARRKARLDDWT
jgi:CRP-like cAMP-binding protein